MELLSVARVGLIDRSRQLPTRFVVQVLNAVQVSRKRGLVEYAANQPACDFPPASVRRVGLSAAAPAKGVCTSLRPRMGWPHPPEANPSLQGAFFWEVVLEEI